MQRPKHPYFDTIREELAKLGHVVPRAMFGHQGYAIGSSLFAFLDEDALVIKTERYQAAGTKLPKGLAYFIPGTKPSRTWIAIHFDDSLDALRRHWSLIQESHQLAAAREISKASKIANTISQQGR
jgi:TfoX/Sxy family transcriptional regulator of competence genes